MEDATGFENGAMTMEAPLNGQAISQTRGRHSAAMQVMKPRTLASVQRRLTEEAMLAADRFFYGWGAGKDKIEGPSIKCATALARCYGNCSIELGPVQETPDAWIFVAYFVDHETGFQMPRQFRQSKKSIVYGKHDEHRKDDIRFQIGQSKAIRNAILNGVPIGLVDGALEAAKSQVGVKLDQWIAKLDKEQGGGKAGSGIVFAVDIMLKALAKLGASEPRVLAKLEIADRKAIDRERLILLRANLSAMEDGEATADELFPNPTPEEKNEGAAKTVDDLRDRLKGNGAAEKPLAEGEIEPLAAALDAFKEAGGVIEEFAEANATTLAKVRASKGKEREMFVKLLEAETKLVADAAAKGKSEPKDGALFDNQKSGASK